MHDSVQAVLADVVKYLDELVRDEAEPKEALARLSALRARHPDTPVELVWEEQGFDDSLHYDALLRPPGGRTISVSVCPDRALPWPLRGVQKWKDSDLLRVNGVVLPVAHAIAQLDLLWDNATLMQRLIDGCLVGGELRRGQVEVSQEEVQAALNALRRKRGLLTAADTHAWMAATGMTHDALEQMAYELAMTAKLRELVASHRVEAYFSEHAASFDRIGIAQVYVRSEKAALEAGASVHNGEEGFLEMAQRAFLRGDIAQTAPLFRNCLRYQFEPELQKALAHAKPGSIVGPLQTRDGVLLAQLLAVEPTELDEHVRGAVKALLFSEWLSAQRREAHIEWFWGTTQQTAHASSGQQ